MFCISRICMENWRRVPAILTLLSVNKWINNHLHCILFFLTMFSHLNFWYLILSIHIVKCVRAPCGGCWQCFAAAFVRRCATITFQLLIMLNWDVKTVLASDEVLLALFHHIFVSKCVMFSSHYLAPGQFLVAMVPIVSSCLVIAHLAT